MRQGTKSEPLQKVELNKNTSYSYLLCGWRTASDLPLTSVPRVIFDGAGIDVLIQIAWEGSPIAKNMGSFVFQHSLERSLIRIDNVADFEITMGRQIRIWPAERSTQKDVEIFLFGPVWATLCHQRRVLPLHASAIVSGDGITAFAGHSGVGKSSIAALMSSLGYKLLADDILPISFNRNLVPGAWPYLRRLKLKTDAINAFALSAAETVSETLDKTKYFVLPKYSAEDEWSRLDRLYVLEVDSAQTRVAVDQLSGADAVSALIDQTYHFRFVMDTGRLGEHLALCTELASKTAVYRLRRSPSLVADKEFGSFICAHLQSRIAQSCRS
jgi:hypothetical protein